MTTRNRRPTPLTPLQQAILEKLWSEGEATAERVREALLPEHRLKDSSVRTLLRRLEARGYVRHELDGKTFVYRAELPPNAVAAGAVREIIRHFCSGSVEQFLVGMVDEKVLTAKDLERLARKVRKR
jgi:BlaI family penicillinase repressor